MTDAQAIELYRRGEYVTMFRQLNGIWMVVILETLDYLAGQGMNLDTVQWRNAIGQAGIDVQRMEAAMAAVRAKRGRANDWNSFQANVRLTSLPQQQRDEIRAFLTTNSPAM